MFLVVIMCDLSINSIKKKDGCAIIGRTFFRRSYHLKCAFGIVMVEL